LSKRMIEVQLKIIITDAALHIRSRKIQKRPRIGLSACLEQQQKSILNTTKIDFFKALLVVDKSHQISCSLIRNTNTNLLFSSCESKSMLS